MSTEDIRKVIAYYKMWRDVAHDNALHLEEETADLEGKLGLTDGERVILDHIASKLQMYDSKFRKYQYRHGWCGGPQGKTEDLPRSWPHDDGFLQADDKLSHVSERLSLHCQNQQRRLSISVHIIPIYRRFYTWVAWMCLHHCQPIHILWMHVDAFWSLLH